MHSRTGILLGMLLVAAAGCRSEPGGSGEAVEWALDAIEVPSGHRKQVEEMLKSLLQPQKARIELSPDGRLLVMAPRGMHEEIRKALAPLRSTAVAAPATLRLTYWMVRATPRPAGGGAPVPAGLQEIAPALAEVEKAAGPAQMSLIERVVLRSTGGEVVETDGRTFLVKQSVEMTGGRIVGKVELRGNVSPGSATKNRHVLNTAISLAPGQTAVIAELGATTEMLRDQKDDPQGDSTLVIAVKAVVDDTAAGK